MPWLRLCKIGCCTGKMKVFKLFFRVFILCALISLAQAKSIKVYLDWFLNPHHAILVVGQQSGIFEKHGLTVDLIAAGGSEEGSRQVAAGSADFAVSKQSAHLIRCTNQGMPLVRIATFINRPLECLITSSKIKSIADLKGKRIGYTSSSIEFAQLSIAALLATAKLKSRDVTLVPVTSGMVSAFLSGTVDAIFSAYRTYELADIKEHQPDVSVFYYEDNGIPTYDQGIIVANRHHLSDARAFVSALQETADLMRYSPEQAWTHYAKAAPEQNTDKNKKIFMSVIDMLPDSIGALNVDQYNRFAQFLSANNILQNPIPQYYAVDGTT